MPDKRQLVQEWFAHGEDDLKTIRIAFPEGGPLGTAAFLLQQVVEKYLKGYLIYEGWRLRKTHDLVILLDEATKYDASFQDFLDLARQLNAYYVESRYPADTLTTYSREEIADALSKTEHLVAKVRNTTKIA